MCGLGLIICKNPGAEHWKSIWKKLKMKDCKVDKSLQRSFWVSLKASQIKKWTDEQYVSGET